MTRLRCQVAETEAVGWSRSEFMKERPYTPETLADRWNCSAEKIRQMFHRGELPGFRLGKLIRFPAIEIERYECSLSQQPNNTSSSHSEESSRSRSGEALTAVDIRLARMIRA